MKLFRLRTFSKKYIDDTLILDSHFNKKKMGSILLEPFDWNTPNVYDIKVINKPMIDNSL